MNKEETDRILWEYHNYDGVCLFWLVDRNGLLHMGMKYYANS